MSASGDSRRDGNLNHVEGWGASSAAGATPAPVSDAAYPQRFRKRPVEIEAARWNPDDPGLVVNWIKDNGGKCYVTIDRRLLVIETLEGPMVTSGGSMVVRGVQGEFYPVKPDIFEETYEPA